MRVRARTRRTRSQVLLVGDMAPSTRTTSTSSGNSLCVHQRAADDVDLLGQVDRATRRGRGRTCGSPSSRRARRWRGYLIAHCSLPHRGEQEGNCSRSFAISATVAPWRKIAPVGHACTHLPHEVQVADSPHGWARSVITNGSTPRARHVPGVRPSISSQARTQRGAEDAAVVVDAEALVAGVHGQLRVQVVEADVIDALRRRQRLQLAVAVRHAHRADVVALREEQLEDHPRGTRPASELAVRTTMPSATRVTQAGKSLATRPARPGTAGRRRPRTGRRGGTGSGCRCRSRAPRRAASGPRWRRRACRRSSA